MVDSQKAPKQVFLPVVFSLVMAVGLILGGFMQRAGPVVELVRYKDTLQTVAVEGTVEELIRYIDARYVDPVEREQLIGQAVASVMEQLDPHSEYLNPLQVHRLKESREGRFSGIGIEFIMIDDTLTVLRALPGSPAQIGGLRTGDRILQIDTVQVSGQQLAMLDVAQIIQGYQGSRLRIRVHREGSGLQQLQLRRATIPVPSVTQGLVVDTLTGYIAIKRFGANTYREFMHSLEVLVEQHGIRNLLIDLRGNPGGFLNEAIQILSQLFSEKNKLLVYTVGRAKDRREYNTTGRNFFPLDKLILLVDENSASASEIMAGAIQDWDRGLIVGRRTYGKGLVQEQYPLSNGAALLLTIARYFTPSGRSIQRDYSDHTAYGQDRIRRLESGELLSDAPKPGSDSLLYYTYHGRQVYGGGGIQPDVILPLDTIRNSRSFLMLTDWVHRFVIEEVLSQPSLFLEEESLDSLRIYLQEHVPNHFRSYLHQRKPTLETHLKNPLVSQAILFRMRTELARIAGGEDFFTEVSVRYDEEVQQAIRLFSRQDLFEKLKN